MKKSSTIRSAQVRTVKNRLWLFPLLFLTVLFAAPSLYAQVSFYPFSQSTGTYTPITGGTLLGTASNDDDVFNNNTTGQTAPITNTGFPIGFNFTYNGVVYDKFAVSTNGYIVLGTGSFAIASDITTVLSNTGTTGFANVISAFNTDLVGQATSELRFATIGTSPTQQLVVQWTNYRRYAFGGNNGSFSFQIVLNEGSNQINFLYGPITAPTSGYTCGVGLRGATNADFNNRTSATSWAATTAGTSTSTITLSATVTPAPGLIFTWNVPPPCAPPTSLAASVTATATSQTVISGNFTAAAVPPTGYVVIRTTTNTPPAPVNGTTYTVGTNAIGYIEYVGTNPGSWTSTGLTPNTTYYYWVYSYASFCSGGSTPQYSATAAAGSATTQSCSFPPGTYTVGASGNFTSLTSVSSYLSNCSVGGAYIFELLSDYAPASETYPIAFPNMTGSSAANTVTIRPAAGSTASITSANTTGTLNLNGLDYLILDGRPGGTGIPKTLVVENTSTSGYAVQFLNDATNNVIKYVTLKSTNTSTTGATVVFGNTTGTTGNDNNLIDNCDLRDGATTPTNAIYSAGSTSTTVLNNSNNTVSNSNIYNYFSATNNSNGIAIASGNTDWTINANNFYQTATRTGTSGSTHTGIQIANTSGNNFIVTNNFIGGSAPGATGSAWNVAGSVTNRFIGINIAVGATASTVQGNTVANMTWLSSSGPATLPGVWAGIYLSSGIANITNNTIGSGTGTGSVTVTTSTTGAASVGIGVASSTGGTINVNNNTVGSINVSGTTASISHGINAIWNTGSPTTLNINTNTVGSATTANSINAINAFTAATAQVVNGILSSGSPTPANIGNNIIANINNAYVPTAANGSTIVRGISTTSGVNNITGNTVQNLGTAANANGTAGTASVIGISQTSTTAGQTVSQNTISQLNNTHATASVSVVGIHVSGPTTGTNLVARNFVYAIGTPSTSSTAELRGISISAGLGTYQNNMVSVGAGSPAAIAYGIYDVSGTNNIYHNTVYVGGTGVTGTANSFAFRSDVTTNVRAFVNNIFINARSNGSGTGKNYAVRLAGTAANPAGLTSNYNIYQATGTGGVFGFFNSLDVANLAAWQTATAKDANSLYADPCLSNPTAAVPDLHLTNCAGAGSPANAAGTLIAGVTVDFDGETRSGLTPVDIGADAGNYGTSGVDISALALVTPTAGGCKTNAETVTIQILNNSSTPIDFSVNNATVTATATGGYNSTATVTTGILAPGGTQNVVMPATINMAANGTYTFNASATAAGDVNTGNDAMLPVVRTVAAMGGTYTVGVGGNYNTLTAAVADYNSTSCITAPIIFSLTDATYPTEVFPITVNANSLASAVNTLTIVPASGVSPLITGSSSASIIKLFGADYITIDGSNNGTGSRNLTLENTNASGAVVWFGNVVTPTADAATHNTLKNTNMRGGSSTTTTAGVVISSGATLGSAAEIPNSYTTISNNAITKLQNGVFAVGNAASPDQFWDISGNTLGSTVTADKLGFRGIAVQNAQSFTVNNNTIAGVTTSSTSTAAGILIGAVINGGVVNGNKITDIKNTNSTGYGSNGISLNSTSTAANLLVSNNFISNVASNGYADATIADNGYGIIVNQGAGYNIYYNSVWMNTSQTVSGWPAAINVTVGVTAANAIDLRNNLFINTQTVGTERYAIYCAAPNTVFSNINYNDYYTTGANLGYIGTGRTNLAAVQAGFGQNANSVSILPVFTSGTDLHLPIAPNTALIDLATPLAAVTTDIDNDPRGTKPDMGADEFANRPTPPSLTQRGGTPSCTGGSALYATPTAPANIVYYLQTSATDTSVTTPFVGDSVQIFVNGTYYVNARNTLYNLWSTSASIVVNNIPVAPLPPSPVADLSPACLSTNLTVPAPGSPNVTFYWQGTTAGGTSTAQNASSPLTVTASGTYYVSAFDATSNCWSNTNGVAVVIDTQVPATPNIVPASPAICIGGTQLLSEPPVPVVSETTPSGLGTAATAPTSTTSTLGPNPFQNYYGGDKQQMLFTAAELTAMGLQPGAAITSVSMQMATVSTAYPLLNLRVKMKLTATTALTTWETGMVTVRPAASYTPIAGWNELTLPSPITWNGTSNLVVEINYSNANGGTSSANNTAYYTATPFTSTIYYRDDNQSAATVDGYTGTPTYTYNTRNNFKFKGSVTPAPRSFRWSPATALYTNAATTVPYVTGNYKDSVYAKPTVTTVYSVTATQGTCNSAPASVTVTVNPLPNVDAGATQSVCPGGSVTLSGSGAATYTWNNGVTNNTPFTPVATTLYTVTGTDANQCSATDTVTVFISPTTPVTITASGPTTICQGNPLTLTANGPAAGPATTITQWNFNNSDLMPNIGTGTASYAGGTSGGATPFPGGSPNDLGIPNLGWNTTNYPATGSPKTAGAQFNLSTTGYQGVVLTYDVRHTATAANTYAVQYNPDVTNVNAPWIDIQTLTYNVNNTFQSVTLNLSAIPAANNNPNLGIRIVSAYDASGSVYVGTTGTYGSGGTVRYDLVTFTGNPITATYAWSPGGQTTPSISPTVSGTYTVTVTQPGVCPGTASTNVTVNPAFATVVNPTICSNQTYPLFGASPVNTTGIYTENRLSVNGCDSTVIVNLTVYPTYNTAVPVTICSNANYTLANGDVVNTSGTYTRTVPSVHNCDSTVVVTLTVLPAQSVNVPQAICAGSSYTLPNGTTVTASGSYTSTFVSVNGCDSSIVTVLTVKPVFTSTQNRTICSGQSQTMPDGTLRTAAGTYTFPYQAVNGCDSTITVNLTVNPVFTTNLTVNICPGSSYTLVNNTVVNTSGTYTAQTQSVRGCDSTVIVVLNVRPTYNTPVNASICQGGSYTLVNGQTVNTAGSYTAATHSVYGCDSLVTVNLTIKPTYTQSVNASVCQGLNYLLPNGTQVSAAGTYTSVLQSSAGCDSTIITHLTVNPKPVVNLGSDISSPTAPVILNAGVGFSSYLWNTNATTQTISVSQNGTYSVTVTNQSGCSASDTIVVHFTTSIVSLGDNGGAINVFPNPSSDRFTLNVSGYTGGGKMKLDLINVVGQVVKTEMIGNATESFMKEMDVASLPSGTYTLRVTGVNAEASLRIIIAR